MTLKTILKNFLNYADTLEAQKKLGKDIYEADFQVFINFHLNLINFYAYTQVLKRKKEKKALIYLIYKKHYIALFVETIDNIQHESDRSFIH